MASLDRFSVHANGAAAMRTRNDPAAYTFPRPWGSVRNVPPSRVTDAQDLADIDLLSPPPDPPAEMAERCALCIEAHRHSRYFNTWMSSANFATHSMVDSEEGPVFSRWHSQLASLDVDLANEPTGATAHLPARQQTYRLLARVRDILRSGLLNVGSSTGFSHESAYLHIGCVECGAAVHITCPKLTATGSNAERIGAIDSHLFNFLCGPGLPRIRVRCTAETAWPGARHMD